MTAAKFGRVYHRLVVAAEPGTAIWLVDDAWFLVQKAVGLLDTSLLPGRYFLEFGSAGLRGDAYPLVLDRDLRFTRQMLAAGPACRRQAPKV